eukprot:4518845-Pyramimonas_sp.AAC.2
MARPRGQVRRRQPLRERRRLLHGTVAYPNAPHNRAASVKKGRENRVLSRVTRWLDKVLTVNSTATSSEPRSRCAVTSLGFVGPPA